jgi:hypothetical protein
MRCGGAANEIRRGRIRTSWAQRPPKKLPSLGTHFYVELGRRPARMRQTSQNLCGPSAQPQPCPTSHSKFGPFCPRLIQRRLGCCPARMRQTSPNLCGPSAQPPSRQSSHSKFGLIGRPIQRRLACRPARMQQTLPNLCGPSAQPLPCP